MGIYIWGTGCGAGEIIDKGLEISKISAFIETEPQKESFMGKPIIGPDELREKNPDLIIVASRFADEISARCRDLGINESKLLFTKDYNELKNKNHSCKEAERILGKELLNKLLPRQYVITVPSSLEDEKLKSSNDYVRTATLELISRRISSVPGALAELGVYKGGFASCMNKLMPERTIYLFDTFSGFGSAEAGVEKSRNSCGDGFLNAHENTSVDLVLKKLPYPQKAVIKKGLFPDSLKGLEERFCLVSLDADFKESTLQGLRYFWPRINPGGYLMMHDWGCKKLRGVSEALEIYEAEIGCRLPGVPIADIGNSLVLQKY